MIFRTIFLLFLSLSTGCAVNKVDNRDIQPSQAIETTLPVNATLAIYIPNDELNEKFFVYHGNGSRTRFHTGLKLEEASFNVAKKYFKKVERFSNETPLNYLLKLESEVSLSTYWGIYKTTITASLYNSNGKLIDQSSVTESEKSSFLHDRNAFYNAYVDSVKSYLDNVIQNNDEFKTERSKKEKPKPISFENSQESKFLELSATGSGFFINNNGYIVTNQHTVGDCLAVSANYNGVQTDVFVIASDKDIDIAVLKTNIKPKKFATFLDSKYEPRLGEETITVGFPLHGILSNEPTLTAGNISALAGLEGNESFLQISTPVQPGNSGGPLINGNGLIHGVVQSKLDVISLAAFTGDIAQNINFAIKSGAVIDFLKKNGVKFSAKSPSRTTKKSIPDIADEATKYTLQLMCHG